MKRRNGENRDYKKRVLNILMELDLLPEPKKNNWIRFTCPTCSTSQAITRCEFAEFYCLNCDLGGTIPYLMVLVEERRNKIGLQKINRENNSGA